jgi:hypothetical protein
VLRNYDSARVNNSLRYAQRSQRPQRAGTARAYRLEAIVLNRHERCLVEVKAVIGRSSEQVCSTINSGHSINPSLCEIRIALDWAIQPATGKSLRVSSFSVGEEGDSRSIKCRAETSRKATMA